MPYIEYLHRVHRTAENIVSQTGKKQGERADRLKRHHPDFPLCDLTAKKIEEILFYWGKRPVDANEKRYSRDTCKNQLILIRAFLPWLHRSDLPWKLPSDYLFPRIKIEWLPSEVSGEVKKRTFTLSEVGVLWKHATPLERVFIALGLNCGFGAAEMDFAGIVAHGFLNFDLSYQSRKGQMGLMKNIMGAKKKAHMKAFMGKMGMSASLTADAEGLRGRSHH